MKVFRQGKHIWWQKPKIRTDENIDKERKASWLELFYDLMFVTVLSQLSHYLFRHPTFEGVGIFIFLFIPAWWIWNSITYYNERYEVNDIRHRIFIFICMIPMAGLAFSIHSAIGDKANIFALSYIFSRLLIIYLWLTAGESKLESKLAYIFTAGFMISVALWVASVFVPAPGKYFFWGTGLLIEMLTPLATLSIQARLPKISASHIPERFGLLIILTIGETVIGSVNGLAANEEFTLLTGIYCALGLCISFLLWWLYIDHVMYRIFKRNVWYILSWSYLHLPLAFCITAVGAGILALVSASQTQLVPLSVHWLLCGAVAGILLITALIGLVSENSDHHYRVIKFHKKNNRQLFIYKIIAAFLAISVGIWGSFFNTVMLLGALVVILFIPATQGLHLWLTSHLQKTQ